MSTLTPARTSGRFGAAPRSPVTAFVLSGGSSHGAMQAGMLRALYERGIVPDMLVGTSAGALNATFIASRPTTVATSEDLARVWRGLHREDIFPIQPRLVLSALANHRDHLVSDAGLRRLIGRHLQIARLEEAAIPVHLIAYDILSGAEIRLSEGPALDAVLAAAAIPGVLPPVPHGEALLVDGGVVNNTPISHAVELGAERIYVMPSDDPTARGLPAGPRGALDASVHAFSLLLGARLEVDLQRYHGLAELIVLPAVNRHYVHPIDFEHASSLIGDSLAAARSTLDALAITGAANSVAAAA